MIVRVFGVLLTSILANQRTSINLSKVWTPSKLKGYIVGYNF